MKANNTLNYTFLSLGAVIIIVPFLWMVAISVSSTHTVSSLDVGQFFKSLHFSSFSKLFLEYSVSIYIINSFIVSLFSTLGQVILCALSGYIFARAEFKYKNIIFIVYLATMMMPVQATIIPQYILVSKMGLTNTYLGLIIPGLFAAFGTFLMKQHFSSIPKAIEEAAILDGIPPLKIFFYIMLPLVKPGLAVLTVMSFMASWNDYLWPLMVASDQGHTTLPLFLAQLQGAWYVDYSVLMAGTLISVIPILIVYLSAQKHFIQSVASVGVK
ncbi:carbohydrate ABC transporter permease (plasmid) [Photobacterium sp. DA100]|uniref:carbohydrate ABC transporter permease n=1 Tax=Photobacterium sp. DA100 TaxID=3027472 RepID=UPI00247ADD0C|nr:carbohydrate ABC transporter permease [Photobacterium sp. DA100]WEM45526.1 carbohydrate ABC transporter permease [Photobacterium sp. DA100]